MVLLIFRAVLICVFIKTCLFICIAKPIEVLELRGVCIISYEEKHACDTDFYVIFTRMKYCVNTSYKHIAQTSVTQLHTNAYTQNLIR